MTPERAEGQIAEACPAPAAASGQALWTAVVLAGSRPEKDVLAAEFKLPLKAMVPIAGAPMISHVVRTLVQCPSIARILIVAQNPDVLDCAELRSLAEQRPIDRVIGKGGIAESLLGLAGTDAAPWPILVTTADHPLLTPAMIEHFLARSEESDASLAVVDRTVLAGHYPQSRRTWLRFRAGAYTGANLFTLRTPRSAAGLKALARGEASRKNQLKLLWHFGPALAFGALTRTMSLEQVVARGGSGLGMKLARVVLPFAEAGMDVDSMNDWRFADRFLSERHPARPEGPAIPISVFDLDRTLTRRGTYTAFLLYAAWRRAPWRLLLAPLAISAFARHLFGSLKRKALKERLQALFLGKKVPRGEVARIADAFVKKIRFHHDALQALEAERSAGRRILLATAANAFYVDAIARALRIDDIVCTGSTWEGEDLTPSIAGENCYGPEKLAMLKAYLREAGLEGQALHIRFFSDHPSDQPVFCWADEAFVVNPPRRFRAHAAAAGWMVLDWS